MSATTPDLGQDADVETVAADDIADLAAALAQYLDKYGKCCHAGCIRCRYPAERDACEVGAPSWRPAAPPSS